MKYGRILLATLVAVTTPAAAAQGSPLAQVERQIAAGKLGKIAAILVEQHGQPVYTQRFGGMTDRHDIRSAGKSIIPESWIREMLQSHRQIGQYVHYGYLWWFWPYTSPAGPQGSWMMQGNGGNIVAIFRDYDAVIVVQAANYNKPDAHAHSLRIIEAALASLPAPPPKR